MWRGMCLDDNVVEKRIKRFTRKERGMMLRQSRREKWDGRKVKIDGENRQP